MKAPYGSWSSPISSDLIVGETIGIRSPTFHQGDLFWIESRPQEAGRNVLVRRDKTGQEIDVNPAPFNIRTRVHEYGGDAWLLVENTLYFSNFADQQLYRQDLDEGEPEQLTHCPDLRFANGTVDINKQRIIAVIEDHANKDLEAANKLASIDLKTGKVDVLVQGHNFFAAPELSHDGHKLAWITWEHPNMPWDESVLWLADIDAQGQIQNQQAIAGGKIDGKKISVQQPRFSASGKLYFISDHSGWGNIYCFHDLSTEAVLPRNAEFGLPHWGFGLSTYLLQDSENLLSVFGINNESHLGHIDLKTNELREIETPYSNIDDIQCAQNQLIFVGASATSFDSIVMLDLDNNETQVIKQTNSLDIDDAYFSIAETIEFPTADNETAHAFFYPPCNNDYQGVDGELPPLLVMLHGGPTGATYNSLNLRTQYWTSRGFAVVDLNYRGSSGYGRAYQDKLLGNWGIVDVEDCVFVCTFLGGSAGRVDSERLAIRGGSAGGYTTLAALTFTDTFKAGASHYGIGDLEALAKDTHKFESRYLDSVIGPYPERRDIYQARSPINHVDQLASPCIFFQGLEDKVVLPNQAEAMVDALEKKGIPVAYVPFEGEQHGFRKAENIKRCLDLELYFYSRIFGFSTADQIKPIDIKNLKS